MGYLIVGSGETFPDPLQTVVGKLILRISGSHALNEEVPEFLHREPVLLLVAEGLHKQLFELDVALE